MHYLLYKEPGTVVQAASRLLAQVMAVVLLFIDIAPVQELYL